MSGTVSGNEFAVDAPPDEDLAAFQSVLRQFKTEGCNLLVAGDVSREVFTRASESMLGDPEARRWRVFALTDATLDSVHDRLPATSEGSRTAAERAAVVDHAVPPRPTTDSAETSLPSVPEVRVGEAGLAELRTALVDVVREFRARSLRPAEVRVSVDSLAPLLDHYEFEAVRRFLRRVAGCVHDCDAMAHYVLPEPYDGDRCQRLASEFDAVVELRTTPAEADEPAAVGDSSSDTAVRSHDAEERWHLPASGATMPWVPL